MKDRTPEESLRFDAEVRCLDGRCGRLRRVVLAPRTGSVTHLVIRIGDGDYALVLVPGDRGLDYPKLRAHLGVRRLTMPSPEEAQQATGYARGTITPLGAGGWPVIVDSPLMAHPEVSLGAGVGEWAIHLSPADLIAATGATVADISAER